MRYVAWLGQTTPPSGEGDYLENIAQIQKAWDRELLAFREELQAKADSIEEISIVPSQKDIDCVEAHIANI